MTSRSRYLRKTITNEQEVEYEVHLCRCNLVLVSQRALPLMIMNSTNHPLIWQLAREAHLALVDAQTGHTAISCLADESTDVLKLSRSAQLK